MVAICETTSLIINTFKRNWLNKNKGARNSEKEYVQNAFLARYWGDNHDGLPIRWCRIIGHLTNNSVVATADAANTHSCAQWGVIAGG